MSVAVIWPLDLLKVSAEDWHLSGRTLAAGGIYRGETLIDIENREWRVELPLFHLVAEDWRRVRVILDELRGRVGVVSLPVVTAAAQAAAASATTYDGGILFDNGAGFAAETLEGVTVAADAPAGATRIRLSVGPSLIAPAAMFSLPGDHVYRASGADGAELKFNPPLRRAVRAGDAADFIAPRARMRLDLDDARLARISANRSAPVTLPMVEAF